MRNITIDITDSILTIKVDLTQNHGLNRSGSSLTTACTDGNVPLISGGVYRDEIINLVVFRKRPPEEIDHEKVSEVELLRKQWRELNVPR